MLGQLHRLLQLHVLLSSCSVLGPSLLPLQNISLCLTDGRGEGEGEVRGTGGRECVRCPV